MSFRINIREVDTASLDAFRAQVDQAIANAENDGGRLVLDLSEVAFMDSTGIGVLVELIKQHGDLQLSVVNARPAIAHLFQVTGLDGPLSAGSN